jgi:phosphoserine phosphatase
LPGGIEMNVYDFDGTIYKGDSSLDFYLFTLMKRPYIIFLLPYQCFMCLLLFFHICSKEKMKEAFFSFVKYVSIETMVIQFWESHCKKIQQWYLKQKQDTDVIISASPEFLLTPLVCNMLGVKLIASKINTISGKYTGKNCYGDEKARQFKFVFGNEKIDNFYSDSRHDAPMANIAEKAFLVKSNHIFEWDTK